MRYSQIRKMDVSNGEGLGVSLFVQGCHFRCKGCFNQETWDFDGGQEWTPDVEEKFMALIDHEYIRRASILGGEPLADENVVDVFRLVLKIKKRFPNKIIWLYTGYSLDYICSIPKEENSFVRYCVATAVDVLVDGQFQIENQDLNNRTMIFAGSTNQRIIDMKKTLKYSPDGRCELIPVMYKRKYDGSKD